MRVIDVFRALGKFEGTPEELVIALIKQAGKEGFPRPLIPLKHSFILLYKQTRNQKYMQALDFLLRIEFYVKGYNNKDLRHLKPFFRKVLKGYRLI